MSTTRIAPEPAAVDSRNELEARLVPYGQDHVLQFWDDLAAQQRESLAQQIQAIDLDQLDRLIGGDVATCELGDLCERMSAPAARRIGQIGPHSVESASRVGEEALRCGLFGVVIVAGGQGSRLGFPHPKGSYPIGPVSGASLFQILIEKILAAAARYETEIPLYLMTSPATHDETVKFLEEHGRFGLAADELFVFCQGTLPAVEENTGKLILADKHQLFLSPDGHGGMLTAMQKSGALEDMRRRGIEHLFYCQVDNPLVEMLSPEFVGYHILAASDVTTQVVAKRDAKEKVGNVVNIDGRLQIIEYSDLPQELAERRAADGSLEIWAGNIAVHAFSAAFLEEAATGDNRLPFHVARKKVPYVTSTGELMKPETPNGIKFEQFIFDLLPIARRSLVVEVSEDDVFAPLKNAEGKDSADDVQQRMVALNHRWLAAIGVNADPCVRVEISPLVARSVEELREKRVSPPDDIGEAWYLA